MTVGAAYSVPVIATVDVNAEPAEGLFCAEGLSSCVAAAAATQPFFTLFYNGGILFGVPVTPRSVGESIHINHRSHGVLARTNALPAEQKIR